MCAARCDEFCNPQKCKDDSYWSGKIRPGRPTNWRITSESTADWTSGEKSKLLAVLNRFPDQSKSVPFDGIYRMKKSVTPTNPATAGSDGKAIVLYDRAFNNPFFSTSRVLTHEFGHVLFLNFSEAERRSYRDKMKWKTNLINPESRPGKFISPRAADSADEDFAENINFFLFEPDVLRAKVPDAYDWLTKKFSKAFKLKEDCQHENH